MVKESNIKIKMLGLGNAGLLFTIPFKVFGPTVSTWNIFNLSTLPHDPINIGISQ